VYEHHAKTTMYTCIYVVEFV